MSACLRPARQRILRLACLPMLLACCVALPGCKEKPSAASRPIAVQAAALRRTQVTSETRFSATVREQQRMELSFKVPGTVVSLLRVPQPDGRERDVHEGDVVGGAPAKPLARLDEGDYRRKLEASRERLAQAQAKEKAVMANLVAARATFDRIKALRDRGSAAQQSYDEQLARRDATEAELEATRREISAGQVAVQQAEDDWKNCNLVVPIARATVSRKYIDVNARVAAGQPVFQIMDLSGMRVAFGVSDKMIGRFQLGQEVTVTAETFRGQRFTGRVTKLQPAADLKTRTFEVEVAIDDPGGLKPGMVVTIVLGQRHDLVLLPMTAILRGQSDDDLAVFTLADENGQKVARKRKVRLDGVYDNSMRLIEEGSQVGVGDLIIVSGAFRVTDGQVVRVLEESDLVRHISL